MKLIEVDLEKCVKCGMCREICPRRVIEMNPQWPEAIHPEYCMNCGQCVAICPTVALEHATMPLSGQISLQELPVINRETAYQFLRSRRSIRSYKQEAIPRDLLLNLMDIARFAPTASNSQGVSYIVIEDKETLQQISALTIDWMEERIQQGHEGAKRFNGYVRSYRDTGTDVILREAPCLIIAVADQGFSNGRDNTHFSFAYTELYAPTLGLGSCYAGLVELCALSGYPALLRLLNLPESKTFTGAIMVGYPKYRYARLVDRNPLDIRFVSQKS
ncbi:MAG: nitroreductase family protein [Sporomusaceae bacterium]|nr:nitroreductase family protein [Sporomusaceae bacterium]